MINLRKILFILLILSFFTFSVFGFLSMVGMDASGGFLCAMFSHGSYCEGAANSLGMMFHHLSLFESFSSIPVQNIVYIFALFFILNIFSWFRSTSVSQGENSEKFTFQLNFISKIYKVFKPKQKLLSWMVLNKNKYFSF